MKPILLAVIVLVAGCFDCKPMLKQDISLTPQIAQNATFLSTFALATYSQQSSDESSALSVLCQNYTVIGDFNRSGNFRFQVFESADNYVIAFRGTTNREETFVDLTGIAVQCTYTNLCAGKVHLGFQEVVSWAIPLINQTLSNSSNKSIYVSGHSLGASLATLTALYIVDQYGIDRLQSVYASGSPKVGDSQYRDKFTQVVANNVPVYRLVQTEKLLYFVEVSDPVTLLPNYSPFVHVVPAITLPCDDGTSSVCSPQQLHSLVNYRRGYQNEWDSQAQASCVGPFIRTASSLLDTFVSCKAPRFP